LALEAIRAVICDVDGVLTDGGILLGSDGAETKRFHVWDGTGIKYLLRSGIEVAFLTGRKSAVVARRAEELGVSHVRQGAKDKLPAYEALAAELGLADEAACYVGDDFPDIPVMRRVGYAVAVADAREEVRAVADYVTHARGGQGAVRELAERLLKAQGKWAALMGRYVPQAGGGGR
jgi:3-deoxy-D-manno-octulosonate 8-phosphate phosphatase (KDO 8-P phosphatase)